MNFNGDGKTWIKVNEVVDSRSYKWGPKPYAKEKIMKLESGEHRVWFTSGIGETWILNGFHAGKSNLV